MRALTAHLGDIKRAWRWAVLLGGAKAAVSVAVFAAIAMAGDQVVRGTDPAPALWFAAVVAAAAVLLIALSHIRQRLLERAALWVDHTIAQDLVTERLANGEAGGHAVSAAHQTDALKAALAGGAATAAIDALWLPAMACALLLVDWRAAAVAGVIYSLGFGLLLIGASGTSRGSGEGERAKARVLADSAIRHGDLVKAASMDAGLVTAWSRLQGVAVATAYGRLMSDGRWQAAGNLFAAVAFAAACGLVLGGVNDGAVARYDAVLMLGAIAWTVFGLRAAIGVAPALKAARSAWRKLIVATRTNVRPATAAATGSIALNDVTFAYPGRRNATIFQAQLTVQPGEAVAITGPAGAGKSTIAALVAGALAPTTGAAIRGGMRIGYVPELPFLVDGTVAEDVARFGRYDLQSVHAAIDRAGVRDILDGLELGVETPLRCDPVQPNGGLTLREARAATIARAVFAPVDVLVIDKPELAMDVRDVHAIAAALQRLRESGVGLLIASNDPRFQALADRFIHIEAGQVIGGSINAARLRSSQPVRLMRGSQYGMAR